VFFAQIFQENTFLKTKPNFPLTGKCFSLTNFSNGKQTPESLESGFPETTFRKTNTAKGKTLFWKLNQIFLWLESVLRWSESVLRWLESVFRWPTFLMANKHRKVWKVVYWKVNSGKQTWPKVINQLDEYVNLSSLPWPDNYKFNNRIAFQIISRENLIFLFKIIYLYFRIILM